jgi:polyferredoxin
MGLVDWFQSGSLNSIHPAATVLLLIGLSLAFLLRKSFCSWICPVGTLSEALARGGRRLFGRNFRVWTWADYLLRSIKYLLFAFFAWNILTMGAVGLRAFLDSPYNRVADLKMGLFFVHLSVTAALVLAVLVVGSVLVQGFWCRYLCPYGALLGLFSAISPTRVRRDPQSCIDCGLCDRICMARLPVSRQRDVLSPECTGCLDCVAVCPVGEALTVRSGTKRMRSWVFALGVVLVFTLAYLGARVSGHWQNEIGDEEYVRRVQQIHDPGYGHPGR